MELTKQESRLLSRIIDSSDTYYIVWEGAYLVPSVALAGC